LHRCKRERQLQAAVHEKTGEDQPDERRDALGDRMPPRDVIAAEASEREVANVCRDQHNFRRPRHAFGVLTDLLKPPCMQPGCRHHDQLDEEHRERGQRQSYLHMRGEVTPATPPKQHEHCGPDRNMHDHRKFAERIGSRVVLRGKKSRDRNALPVRSRRLVRNAARAGKKLNVTGTCSCHADIPLPAFC
jgi:hypothetical protein